MGIKILNINISDITEGINAIVPACAPFRVNIDKDSFFESNKYELFKNPIIDYEKARFYPIGGEEVVKYIFHKNDGSPMYYADLGFVDDDITFLKNRFIKSTVRFNYFDNDNPTSQNLLLQYNLDVQLLADQYDINGDILSASVMPITFMSYRSESNQLRSQPSTNYHLHFFRSFNFPYRVFCSYEFLNARDGQSYRYISKPNIIDVNDFYTYAYNPIILDKVSDEYFYDYDVIDRDITTDGNAITIKLYAVN